MITLSMLRASGASANAATIWLDAMNAAADEFEITTDARVAPWLANVAHECAGFSQMVENLNYAAEALMRLWPCTPRRLWGFTPEESRAYQRRPEQIANRVYANRYGNGPGSSGDGWRYRGRGPMQLTFRANYAEFGDALGIDLIAQPDDALGIVTGARIAGRFWASRGCNELADAQDFPGIRQAINGEMNGFDDVDQRMNSIEAEIV